MAKEKKTFSLTRSLCNLGERILFAPPAGFRVSGGGEKERVRNHRFLPHTLKVKSALSKMTEQSGVLAAIAHVVRRFLSLKIRSFAVFFFACGFVQILSFFAASDRGGTAAETNLVFGAVQMLLTLICSFSKGDVVSALKNSLLHKGFLAPLVGVQDWQYPKEKSHDSLAWMLLFGVGVGVLSFFLSPIFLLNLFLMTVTVLSIFSRPELGFVLSAAGCLFLPKEALYLLVLSTALSYVLKCFLGKRSFLLRPMDAFVLLFFLPFLSMDGASGLSGAFLLFFLYFAASGLLRTVDGVGRLFRALTLSAVLFALLLLSRELLLWAFPTAFLRFPDLEKFFFVLPTPSSGVLIAMACPLILGRMRHQRGVGKKLILFVGFLICLFALVRVKSIEIWVALIIALTVFFVFSYRPALLVVCMASLLVIPALHFLPATFLKRLFAFFGLQEYGLLFPGEKEQGFLALLRAEGGVIWLLLLGALLLWFAYENFRFCRETTLAALHPMVLGGLCAVVLFISVSFRDLSLDFRSLCLLSVLFAVPATSRRAAIREEIRLPY